MYFDMQINCKTLAVWFVSTCQLWISTNFCYAVGKINYQLSTVKKLGREGSTSYTDLEEILKCFATLRHAQTNLETPTKPKLVKLLPMLR